MNYDEMVKLAYEDILDGFEKEASFGSVMKNIGSTIKGAAGTAKTHIGMMANGSKLHGGKALAKLSPENYAAAYGRKTTTGQAVPGFKLDTLSRKGSHLAPDKVGPIMDARYKKANPTGYKQYRQAGFEKKMSRNSASTTGSSTGGLFGANKPWQTDAMGRPYSTFNLPGGSVYGSNSRYNAGMRF